MGRGIGLAIAGSVVPGASTYAVTNPARPTEVVLNAPSASLEQLDEAVGAARAAFASWSGMDFDERAEMIMAASRAAGEAVDGDGLASLLTAEHGKVAWEAQFETGMVSGMAAPFAPLAQRALQALHLQGAAGGTSVLREPHGVVAAVIPFNWPVAVFANKVLPALLTGNTVVVKAPPTCPGALLSVAAAMAAQLPRGVLNALSGEGRDLGEALVAHRGIDLVSFTGGVQTGRAVMAAAARRLTPVVLELGGNDPAIIAQDLEITEELAEKIVGAAFITSGQVCMAIKRLYVPEEQVHSMVDALVARLSKELIGDGSVPEVTVGPVHRPEAKARVETMLAEAEDLGGKVFQPAAWREEDRGGTGYFVSPAVLSGVPDHAAIVAEEQFAPALPVLGYSDLDDAIARANDSELGLCASVWSGDDDLVEGVARRLSAGTVFVNNHGIAAVDYRAPFGGWRQSGHGVELGVEGMAELTRPKTVVGARA